MARSGRNQPMSGSPSEPRRRTGSGGRIGVQRRDREHRRARPRRQAGQPRLRADLLVVEQRGEPGLDDIGHVQEARRRRDGAAPAGVRASALPPVSRGVSVVRTPVAAAHRPGRIAPRECVRVSAGIGEPLSAAGGVRHAAAGLRLSARAGRLFDPRYRLSLRGAEVVHGSQFTVYG